MILWNLCSRFYNPGFAGFLERVTVVGYVLLVIIMNVIMNVTINVASGESFFCINIFIPGGSESIF